MWFNEFEVDIFYKLEKCKYDQWYRLFKLKYPQQKLIDAIKKRIDLMGDFEFNVIYTQFRRIETKENSIEYQAFKEADLQRRSAQLLTDSLKNTMEHPKVIKALDDLKKSYVKKKK